MFSRIPKRLFHIVKLKTLETRLARQETQLKTLEARLARQETQLGYKKNNITFLYENASYLYNKSSEHDKWIERLVAGGFGLTLGSLYLAAKR